METLYLSASVWTHFSLSAVQILALFFQYKSPYQTSRYYFCNFSSRVVPVSAPSTWITVPAHFRSIDTPSNFKHHLKFHLFQPAFRPIVYSHPVPWAYPCFEIWRVSCHPVSPYPPFSPILFLPLIAARWSGGSAVNPFSGSEQSPAAKRFFLHFQQKSRHSGHLKTIPIIGLLRL